MKITDLTITVFTWDGLVPLRYSRHVASSKPSCQLGLLQVHTDEGPVGRAFIGSPTSPAEFDVQRLIDVLKPIVMGQDPLQRERLGRLMWGRVRAASVRTVGAVDTALWDIAGQAAGLPIHALIGGYRRSLPAYASSPARDDIASYCEEALHWKSRGVTAYKIHAPHPWRQDIAVCEAVRRAVGDDHVLMLDASWSYDYPTALRVGRALEALKFHWFEDPLGEWSIPSYVKLRQKLDVPLMATELPFAGFDTYAPWLMAQATDFLRGDVAFKGGITTMLKTAHLAEGFGMNYEIHHGSNSLNNVANLHVAAAIHNCEYFEVLLPDANNKHGLVQDLEIDGQGQVHVPDGPGLGVEVDMDRVRRQQVAVLR
ncbi:enolase C-terminal domain-like protein [Aquabacterium sp. J223]|uniref:enolase C-terminal domain-like protein n=1 Tax=Aquabacterium sp. J223 TaxID=2898431 RepID=UPI0021ADCC23|nr:enolase C-terminal domain-like protein [Aquabacterium sp. J223]UUX94967.1 mandelate racemase [Aquabacterium sp. J223]